MKIKKNDKIERKETEGKYRKCQNKIKTKVDNKKGKKR